MGPIGSLLGPIFVLRGENLNHPLLFWVPSATITFLVCLWRTQYLGNVLFFPCRGLFCVKKGPIFVREDDFVRIGTSEVDLEAKRPPSALSSHGQLVSASVSLSVKALVVDADDADGADGPRRGCSMRITRVRE